MAFSIGTISYTIARLVTVLSEQPAETGSDEEREILTANIEAGRFSDADSPIGFDENGLDEIFENLVKPFEQASAKPSDEKAEADRQETPPEKTTWAEIYEEFTVTEYFLKYNHDYGDLQNLRRRSDFVFHAARLKTVSNRNETARQKEKQVEDAARKSEMMRDRMKRAEQIKLQQKQAEKYTRSFGSKD